MPLIAILFFMGALEGPAEPPGLTREQLRVIRDVAEQLRFGRPPKCGPVFPDSEPPIENVEAAVVLEQVAVFYGFTALNQPRMAGEDPAVRTATIGDRIAIGALARIAAADCLPGKRGVYHLDAALDLLRVWQHQLYAEGLPEDAPAQDRVRELMTSVTEKRPKPPQVPPCKSDKCPVAGGRGVAKQPRGYARFVGLISLRIELGLAGGKLAFAEDGNREKGQYLGPAGRFSAGMRLLATPRHAVIVGGYFGWQHVTSHEKLDLASKSRYLFIYSGGLQLEWGIRLAKGAVSLHPALDVGAQAFFGEDTSGQLRVGGAVGLCVANEVVCLIGRGFFPAPKDNGNGIQGYQVNVGFDVFRAVDRGRRVRAARLSTAKKPRP